MKETVRVRTLAVADLRVSKLNPRRSPGEVDELAASIAHVGVLQPLLVTPDGGGHFLVLAGSRRLAAAKVAGLRTVPAIVRRMNEREREVAMWAENFHRRELSPVENATVFARLMKLHGLNQREVADVCGCSQTMVSHHLALLNLPARVVAAVDRREIPLTEALQLGDYRDFTAKPKAPQGRPSLCSLEGHENHDARKCAVKKLATAAGRR